MIFTYGLSLQGTSHITNDIVCQDAHKIKVLQTGTVVAAIADGVGSSKHSDIAAKIAVNTVLHTIETGLLCYNDAEYIIKLGFITALHNIKCEANANNHNVSDYDTTLTALIYNGERISYGHVGDGGIIGLTVSGDYISITKIQKGDEHNIVIPLRIGLSGWVFDSCDVNFCALLMLTDGLLDIFMPSLLNRDIYVRFARQFMDNTVLNINYQNAETIKNQIKTFLTSESCKPITDDKTIVGIINSDITANKKEASYYVEPDWKKLREEKYKLLYD